MLKRVGNTGVNFAVQVIAFMAAAALNWSYGGFLTAVLVFFVVPMLVLLLPIALAIGVYHRHELEKEVWIPFTGTAVTMVVTSLVLPAGGVMSDDRRIPLFDLLGLSAHAEAWRGPLGVLSLLGMLVYLIFLGWTLIAVSETSSAPPWQPNPDTLIR